MRRYPDLGGSLARLSSRRPLAGYVRDRSARYSAELWERPAAAARTRLSPTSAKQRKRQEIPGASSFSNPVRQRSTSVRCVSSSLGISPKMHTPLLFLTLPVAATLLGGLLAIRFRRFRPLLVAVGAGLLLGA